MVVMKHGLSPARLERVGAVLRGYVDRGEVAGAVALVHRHDQEACFFAVGARDRALGEPMKRDTIFRWASMTKPIIAAALLTFVEENQIRLFDAVDRWLPELANRKVMRNPSGALDDLVPSPRPITLHDLLAYQMGIGWGPSALGGRLMALTAGPVGTALKLGKEALAPDAWMAKLGAMPLPYAPGERWLYHTPGDVAGVLLSRMSGKSLEAVLRERIFEPLGMADASFHVPAAKRSRLAVMYTKEPGQERLIVADGAENTQLGAPPIFESGGGGLVGTLDDFQRFGRMLLRQGELDGVRILSRKTVEAMTTDYLTAEQHLHPFANFDRYDLDGSAMWSHRGFGYGVSVRTSRVGLGPSAGSRGISRTPTAPVGFAFNLNSSAKTSPALSSISPCANGSKPSREAFTW